MKINTENEINTYINTKYKIYKLNMIKKEIK